MKIPPKALPTVLAVGMGGLVAAVELASGSGAVVSSLFGLFTGGSTVAVSAVLGRLYGNYPDATDCARTERG